MEIIPTSTSCMIQPRAPVTLVHEAISQIVLFVTGGEPNGGVFIVKVP